MSDTELRAILRHVRDRDPQRRMINLTGGEPTEHPDFVRLVNLCREEGIHRITLSTHGLRFLKDEHLLRELAQLNARVVLSFDSFKDSVNKTMLGGNFREGKLRVLALLEKYNVDTTLLPVLARGCNDDEMGDFLKLTLDKAFVRSIEFHTMTFTGQGGSNFSRQARYTTYDVLQDLQTQSGGMVQVDDFVPSPSAHPLCYQIAYLLKLDDGRWLPFTRFMSRDQLRQLLHNTLYLEPTPMVEQLLQEVITQIWTGERVCQEAEMVLVTLKNLLKRMFDPHLTETQRLRVAELSAKAVYVHAHMDEENFDTDRIQQCCVGIQEANGQNIPSCAYNVLYRDRDPRFKQHPAPAITELGPGRFSPETD